MPLNQFARIFDSTKNGNLLVKFQQKPLQNWLMGLKKKMSTSIARARSNAFLQFKCKYLFEISFLAMTAIKMQFKNKLNLE